jgi:hypothetical protein
MSVIVPGRLSVVLSACCLIISLILSSMFCEGTQNQPGGVLDSCAHN